MNVLGRCCRVYNLDIVVDGKFQKTLQARARMLRSLPFEPMGKEEHKPAQPAPLFFGADKELIDDDLGRIDEVSELGLPKNQPVGTVQAVPVLEPKHTRLGEGTVVKLHRGLIRSEMLKRHIYPPILDIVQDGMPLAEGSTRRVLTRDTDRMPLHGQCGEGQSFAGRPVKGTCAGCHFAPALQPLGDLRVWMKLLRQSGERFHQGDKSASFDPSPDLFGIPVESSIVSCPHPGRLLSQRNVGMTPGLGEIPLQLTPALHRNPISLVTIHFAEAQEMAKIVFAEGPALVDDAIQERLCKTGLVSFIVATPSKTIHVYHDVTLKGPPEIHREPHDAGDGFGILPLT